MTGVRIIEWTPRPSAGPLPGYVAVEVPSGHVFHACAIFETNGLWTAAPPSKPMIGRDGMVIKDSAGKTKFAKVISFSDKGRRELWSNCVIAALRDAHPEMFT
jgi:hypothetical protein